jgi:hypothetical protein
MGKFKALLADDTKLPWSTGHVRTAKCQNCEQHNNSMFRRCKSCPYTICSRLDCFQKKGFSHFCHGILGNGSGPYPTLAAEKQILAQHDADAPDRDAGVPEPPLHTPAWTPDSLPVAATTATAKIPSLNPARVREPIKKKTGSRKSTPVTKTKQGTPKSANTSLTTTAGRKHTRDIFSDEEVEEPEYAPRSSTRSGRKISRLNNNGPPDPLVVKPVHFPESPFVPEPRIFRTQFPSVNTPSVTPNTLTSPIAGIPATNGNLTIDVRGMDYLTIAPYEGFHAVMPPVNRGVGNGNPEIVYRYISKNDGKLHEEPAARIYDATRPPFEAQAPRIIHGGIWRGAQIDDMEMAFFLSTINSIERVTIQAPASGDTTPVPANTSPSTSTGSASTHTKLLLPTSSLSRLAGPATPPPRSKASPPKSPTDTVRQSPSIAPHSPYIANGKSKSHFPAPATQPLLPSNETVTDEVAHTLHPQTVNSASQFQPTVGNMSKGLEETLDKLVDKASVTSLHRHEG